MNDAINPDTVETGISSLKFWDIYYSSELIKLERNENEYEGIFIDYSKANKTKFVQFPKFTGFTIQRDNLSNYDYEGDGRFYIEYSSLEEILSQEISSSRYDKTTSLNIVTVEALESIILPGGQENAQFPYQERRINLIKVLVDSRVSVDKILNYMDAHLLTEEERQMFEKDGDMSYIHPEREFFVRVFLKHPNISVSKSLQKIILNPYEDHNLVISTIRTLAKLNLKNDVSFLISVLNMPHLSSRHSEVHKALQYICSGDKLLTKPNATEFVTFWKSVLPSLPEDRIGWINRDYKSIFWEKRLNVVQRTAIKDLSPEVVIELLNDEVLPIKNMVQRRLKEN